MHLLRDERHPVAYRWLQKGFQADAVECLGMASGCVQLEARSEGCPPRELSLSDEVALKLLSATASAETVALAWVVCRFHDLDYETDVMLRDFVKTTVGVQPEPVPALLYQDALVFWCAREKCSGSVKNSDEIEVIEADGDVRFRLLLTGSGLRELLLGRLRRTVL